MRSASIVSLAGLLTGLSLQSPVPGLSDSHNIQARQDDPDGVQAGWDMVTEELLADGQCRTFIGDSEYRVDEPCAPYCEKIGEAGGNLGCFAPVDFDEGTQEPADPSIIMDAPDGGQYTYGNCLCSTEVKDGIEELAGKILIELGQVSCWAWYEGLKWGTTALSVLPPAGPLGVAVKGTASILGKVQTVDKYVGGDEVKGAMEENCGDEPWDEVDFPAAYESLNNVQA